MQPLLQKLQLKTGSLHLINAPADYLPLIQPLPAGVEFTDIEKAKPGHIHLFVKDSTELARLFPQASALLGPDTVFWVFYPKKSSGMQSDLAMVFEWPVLFEVGYRPVASSAVDEIWTALRFKPDDQVKSTRGQASARKNPQLAAYIDMDARTVKLPEDVLEALQDYPHSLAFFEQLAFTHRKEYAVWILSARQENTRLARVEKMLRMLNEKKKNPAEK